LQSNFVPSSAVLRVSFHFVGASPSEYAGHRILFLKSGMQMKIVFSDGFRYVVLKYFGGEQFDHRHLKC